MIPAIQSFFEILNYYAGLAFSVVSGIFEIFTYIGKAIVIIYHLFTMMPVYMQFFALMVVAYLIITFVIHPE